MNGNDLFNTALRGVMSNVSRSMLTMLGIVIGVCSVVLMSSVGKSMEGVILGQISSLGAKSMVIFPGNEEGGAGQVMKGFDSLTFEDIEALEKLSSIDSVAPMIFLSGETKYGRETSAPQVLGVTADFYKNQDITATQGRLNDETDDESAAAVAVLAPDTRDDLFGSTDPIGKRITIGDRTYTVIGVTKALGSQFFQNADERIYVPYSLAKQVTGQKYVNQITMLATESFDLAFADVRALLRQRHNIDNPENDLEKDDFIMHSSEEANQILSSVSLGLTMFITTIAAISLIVGGIGIMNIMLVSVTERTREIGLRKAVGARGRDILLQFLVESTMLTFIGGFIGACIGLILAWLAALGVSSVLSTYKFALAVPSIIMAFAMAALTGIVFGISPARKAAKLHPIDSLRYE